LGTSEREFTDDGRGVALTSSSFFSADEAGRGVSGTASEGSSLVADSMNCLRVHDEEGTMGGGLSLLPTDLGGHSMRSLACSFATSLVLLIFDATLEFLEDPGVEEGCFLAWTSNRPIRLATL
jgi:hypothetical protein